MKHLFLLTIFVFALVNCQADEVPSDDPVNEKTVEDLVREASKARDVVAGADVLSAVSTLLPGLTSIIADTVSRYEETLTACDIFIMKPKEVASDYDTFEAEIDACLDKDDVLTEVEKTILSTLFATNDQLTSGISTTIAALKENTEVIDKIQAQFNNATAKYEKLRDAAIARLKTVISNRVSLAKKVTDLVLSEVEDAENLLLFVQARLVSLEELSARILIALSRSEHRYLSLVNEFYNNLKDFIVELDVPSSVYLQTTIGPLIKKFIIADIWVNRLRNTAKRVVAHLNEERTTLLDKVKNFVTKKIDSFVSTDAFKERIADKVRSFLSAHTVVTDEADLNGMKRLKVIAKAAATGDKELLKKVVIAAIKAETGAEEVTVAETQKRQSSDYGIIATYGNAAAATNDNSANLMGASFLMAVSIVLAFVF